MGRLRTLVGTAALALLVGCTGTGTPSPTPTPPDERTFALGAEAMLPCTSGGFPAACGTLQVPEDRGNPTGRMIPLDVVVIPAASERPAADPVFFLAGGPGGAATESWANAPQVFPAIHQDRDIVLVDQRGTGGSNELLFPPAPDVSGLPRSDGWRKVERWAKGALEGLNGDIRYYTSAIAADDLDDVRVALGYDLIDLYGGSYGATLAQYYLRQHEAHVRAVVLDGGTLVDVPIVELMAARSQEALDRVFARCRFGRGLPRFIPRSSARPPEGAPSAITPGEDRCGRLRVRGTRRPDLRLARRQPARLARDGPERRDPSIAASHG